MNRDLVFGGLNNKKLGNYWEYIVGILHIDTTYCVYPW